VGYRIELEPKKYLWDMLADRVDGEVPSRWVGDGQEGFTVINARRKINIEQLEAAIVDFYDSSKGKEVFPPKPQNVNLKSYELSGLKVIITHAKKVS